MKMECKLSHSFTTLSSWWWSFIVSVILRAVMARIPVPGRFNHARLIAEQRPTKGLPQALQVGCWVKS